MELAFGRTMHRDRGVWNDCHDAIGIELRVKAEAEPEPASKRNRMCSDQSDDDACQPGDAPQLARASQPGDAPQLARASQPVVCETQSQPQFANVNLPVIDTLKGDVAQPFATHPGRSRDAFTYNVAGSFINSQITSLFLLP